MTSIIIEQNILYWIKLWFTGTINLVCKAFIFLNGKENNLEVNEII